MSKKVAVLAAGCGVFDGAEIHEMTLIMLALDEAGVQYQVVAPDQDQLHVVNHLNGEVSDERRNCLEEAARIARGEAIGIDSVSANDFDGLVVPGGFGVAKNFCDFASDGAGMAVNESVLTWMQGFVEASKPIGLACIAPVLAPKLFGSGVRCTIGDDEDTAAAINAMGGDHVVCAVDSVCVDEARKLVTTPAYMSAQSISEVRQGTQALVSQVVEWL